MTCHNFKAKKELQYYKTISLIDSKPYGIYDHRKGFIVIKNTKAST